jgi:hypothetical protein
MMAMMTGAGIIAPANTRFIGAEDTRLKPYFQSEIPYAENLALRNRSPLTMVVKEKEQNLFL